jgi:hypothetical protein
VTANTYHVQECYKVTSYVDNKRYKIYLPENVAKYWCKNFTWSIVLVGGNYLCTSIKKNRYLIISRYLKMEIKWFHVLMHS